MKQVTEPKPTWCLTATDDAGVVYTKVTHESRQGSETKHGREKTYRTFFQFFPIDLFRHFLKLTAYCGMCVVDSIKIFVDTQEMMEQKVKKKNGSLSENLILVCGLKFKISKFLDDKT